MKAAYNPFNHNRIRLGLLLSLIFFVVYVTSCRRKSEEEIAIRWNNRQAVGLLVPRSLLKNQDNLTALKIKLENKEDAMLGEYSEQGDYVFFKPLVPLSAGLSYEIFDEDVSLGKILVPANNNAPAPSLLSIYPSSDTLPENLLKLYFQFSAPMKEAEALQHIKLTNASGDTLDGTFLDLKPELWNKERTALTLWLDPGRIKRDLIPNQERGNPLKKNGNYTIVVSSTWKSENNISLSQSFQRNFTVGPRDSISPNPSSWTLTLPGSKSTEPLRISFGETLDYFLLQETISIFDADKKAIRGRIKITNKETGFEFTPDSPWQGGVYTLQVATHLEDLAGNNLQRPFDRDIQAKNSVKDVDYIERSFTISPGN